MSDQVPKIQLSFPAGEEQSLDVLRPGTVIESTTYPGGRSVVIEEHADISQKRLTDERVTRKYEYVTVARPVDYKEKIYEVPTKRHVQTFVPKIQVREVIKTIPQTPEIVEKEVEIPHTRIIDKYVEVPVASGYEYQYVPNFEVHERTVKVPKPEIKWVNKYIEVPQVKEVVRYVESDSNVEQVIRYVPKGEPEEIAESSGSEIVEKSSAEHIQVPRFTQLPQPSTENTYSGEVTTRLATPHLNQIEQLFIPRVSKTVEVQKEVPVAVDIPVPFMVPKPVKIPVEVPVIKFNDHFVPIPVRRHVIPRIIFTDEVYEVECVREKPVLVIEDEYKPVPVDVKIRLKEKDIKIIPVDPSELSQADAHMMWMRVNADLLEQAKEDKRPIPYYDASKEEEAMTAEDVRDPAIPQDQLNLGQLPLHLGHPLMMTYLQAQWMQNPSTLTHNMYTPEFFQLHASALDSVLYPQPHQVNLTQEQSLALGPLPSETLMSPWSVEESEIKNRQKLKNARNLTDTEDSVSVVDSPRTYGTCCSPCCSKP